MEAKHQRCNDQFDTEEPVHQLDDASFAVARTSISAHLPAAGAAAPIDIVHRGCHFLFNEHKVQVHRGDNPAPSGSDPALDDSPDEQEAWREALDVVKAVFPEARGTLIMAGRTYEVPEASTYRL